MDKNQIQNVVALSLGIIAGGSYFLTKSIMRTNMTETQKALSSAGGTLFLASTVLSTRMDSIHNHGMIPAIGYRAVEILSAGNICTPK